MTHIIKVEDVYKSYGDKIILDNVDLNISAGEFCSLIGPSGCGKSTLLRIILGQERQSSGRVLIEDTPITGPGRDRGIVYQKYALFPHLSVLNNILIGPKLGLPDYRQNKGRYREEAISLLDEMHLREQDFDKFPSALSGGMRQRVAIAQAIIMKPKILLMDEPFGALDPGTREDMQVLILSLWEKYKMTVIFVTHDLEEAVYLGSRVIVLSQYYIDGRGRDFKRGAKIVADHTTDRQANPTKIKHSQKFQDLIYSLRQDGFNPDHLQSVHEFNLRHPDSWQTLTADEDAEAESTENSSVVN